MLIVSHHFLCNHSGLINTSKWQWQWGKSQPVGWNITDHVFAPKIANTLKNNELKNWKIENSWPFLTVLFCFNKLKRAAVGTGQKSVCGLRYHWSRFRPKKGNLIEKTVSEGTAKLSRRNVFSPFFLPPRSVLINERGRQWQRGKHRSVGCDIIDHAFDQKEAI